MIKSSGKHSPYTCASSMECRKSPNPMLTRHPRLCAAAMVTVLSVGLPACASPVRPHDPAAKSVSPLSLYERLGGMPVLDAMAMSMMNRQAADPRVNRSFNGVKLAPLRDAVVIMICEQVGGPCRHQGPTMLKAHADFAITHAEYDAFEENIMMTLNEFRIPAEEQRDFMRIVDRFRNEVVSK